MTDVRHLVAAESEQGLRAGGDTVLIPDEDAAAMAAALERDRDAVMAALTAPGAPFEMGLVERWGCALPAFKHAPESLPALFARFCAEHGAAEFLIDGGLRLTFGETYAAAGRLARVLVARHGVRRGDRVAIAAGNSAAYVVAFMAVVMAGGCATLLNRWWTGRELEEAIALAGCELVLADAKRAGRLGAGGARVLVFAHEAPDQAFAGWGKAAEDAPLPRLSGDDLATLLFTSGSSGDSGGKPRGVVSDHRGVCQAVMGFLVQAAMALGIAQKRGVAVPARQVALVCVPLFHVTGLVPLLLASLPMGRALVFLPRWDARAAMRLIEAERVTYFLGVPLMSHEIASHPELGAFDLSCCGYFSSGGAARPGGQVGEIRRALPHAYPLNFYGLTEANGHGAGNFNEACLARPESAGRACHPLVELAILDGDGAAQPAGSSGEIGIRSIATMLGYWGDAAATSAAYTAQGYLRTGDLGTIDAAGYLTITGRAKEIVNRGGETLSCLEVELALLAHPLVAEAVVLAVADARMGEVPLAVWRARDGALAPGEEELRAFLAERLAAFKLPARFVRAGQPLPRLAAHKIDRRAVRLRYASARQHDMQAP